MGRHRWLKKERNRRAAAEEAARPRREKHLKSYYDDMMGWLKVMMEEVEAGKLPNVIGISHEFGYLVALTKKALGLATLTEAAKAVQAAGHDYARTFGILEVDIAAEVSKSDNPMAPFWDEMLSRNGFWDEMLSRNGLSAADLTITNAAELRSPFDGTEVTPEALRETLTAMTRTAAKINTDIEFVGDKAYIRDVPSTPTFPLER